MCSLFSVAACDSLSTSNIQLWMWQFQFAQSYCSHTRGLWHSIWKHIDSCWQSSPSNSAISVEENRQQRSETFDTSKQVILFSVFLFRFSFGNSFVRRVKLFLKPTQSRFQTVDSTVLSSSSKEKKLKHNSTIRQRFVSSIKSSIPVVSKSFSSLFESNHLFTPTKKLTAFRNCTMPCFAEYSDDFDEISTVVSDSLQSIDFDVDSDDDCKVASDVLYSSEEHAVAVTVTTNIDFVVPITLRNRSWCVVKKIYCFSEFVFVWCSELWAALFVVGCRLFGSRQSSSW